ncbi:hypothetical protein ES708_31100 [subsurface metagenome]
MNRQLNNTYIPYGTLGYEKKALQAEQDANASHYGSVNSVKRAVSKSSHVYNNRSWDLVDAAEEEDFSIDKIKTSDLPAEMQKMDREERTEYIVQKAEERNNISKEIQELNKKRAEYVTEHSTADENEGMLDKAILSSLKEQAKTRNFVIE